NLLKMAREGLLHGLRSAIQEVRRSGTMVRSDRLRVRTNGGWHEVSLQVIPLGTSDRPHYLVLFEEAPRPASSRERRPVARAGTARSDGPSVGHLETELASTREHLQSMVQELEATNEELQSANEEILSANEELQSTNEELDTAKEELHSPNDELTRANSDLLNLLGSVQIALVIVATDLRIRRFTPMAERVLNLIA